MTSRAFQAAVLIAAACSFLPVIGCENNTPPAPASPPASTPGDATYTVRGRIAMLPEEGKPLNSFMVTHEEIPGFKDREGKVVGMAAMTMPLGVGKDIDLSSWKVGDLVSVTFDVRWASRATTQVTRIERLPEGTELDLPAPRPAPGGP